MTERAYLFNQIARTHATIRVFTSVWENRLSRPRNDNIRLLAHGRSEARMFCHRRGSTSHWYGEHEYNQHSKMKKRYLRSLRSRLLFQRSLVLPVKTLAPLRSRELVRPSLHSLINHLLVWLNTNSPGLFTRNVLSAAGGSTNENILIQRIRHLEYLFIVDVQFFL